MTSVAPRRHPPDRRRRRGGHRLSTGQQRHLHGSAVAEAVSAAAIRRLGWRNSPAWYGDDDDAQLEADGYGEMMSAFSHFDLAVGEDIVAATDH
jgi:hypothetical protein